MVAASLEVPEGELLRISDDLLARARSDDQYLQGSFLLSVWDALNLGVPGFCRRDKALNLEAEVPQHVNGAVAARELDFAVERQAIGDAVGQPKDVLRRQRPPVVE
jgi:hypothetical protein